MTTNLIIINNLCSAGCKHCPHSKNSATNIDKDSPHQISQTGGNFVLLSGGEPFELKKEILFKYIKKCVEVNKYFKIATGGHIDLVPIVPALSKLPFYLGLQIGTDVILQERNVQYKNYQEIWLRNIVFLNDNYHKYSITLTLSLNVNFRIVKSILEATRPAEIMVNLLDGTTFNYSKDINFIKSLWPWSKISYGYIG